MTLKLLDCNSTFYQPTNSILQSVNKTSTRTREDVLTTSKLVNETALGDP